LLYRAYLTDAAMALTNNVAHALGGQCVERRYMELLAPRKPERSAQEIARDVIRQAGLEVIG